MFLLLFSNGPSYFFLQISPGLFVQRVVTVTVVRAGIAESFQGIPGLVPPLHILAPETHRSFTALVLARWVLNYCFILLWTCINLFLLRLFIDKIFQILVQVNGAHLAAKKKLVREKVTYSGAVSFLDSN